MKFPTLSCIVVAMTASASPTKAQSDVSSTPRPTPPSEPILSPAPSFSAWTVVRQLIPGLEKQPVEGVVKIVTTANKPDSLTTVVKTGVVRHQTTTQKTQEKEDIWYEHGNCILMESFWKAPMFQRAVNSPNQPAGPDFPEFSWITPKNFVGTQDAQGGTYFVFESDVAQGDARTAREYGQKQRTTHNRALINADTHLPWLLQTESTLLRYVYQAPPTDVLVVPPDYKGMFDAF